MTFQELKRNSKKQVINSSPYKVAVLGDTATQFLTIAIKGMAYERNMNIAIYEADYNQIERQILDPLSDYHVFAPDYTVIFQSTHKLLEKYLGLFDAGEAHGLAEKRLNALQELLASVVGKVIYYNYPEIDDTVFGNYSNKVENSFLYQLRKLNYELANLAQRNANLFICDLASIQNKYGRDFMFDSSIYTSTEMVLSIDCLPYVAARTIDIICAIEGKFKKCLILDLDNTLWGGVVGDDGWENIQIGHDLGIGKVYTELQQWIKKLKMRGIILAVCSKNDAVKAKEPFEKNPEMVLKLDDIAVFIANWENKADNIKSIQQILNIGFDSMVFLDDNPFERNIVRENIADICVPELPEDPSEYLEYLYSLNLFETASYHQGDANRTKQYQVETKREMSKKSFTNEDDFLQSLEMVSEVTGFNKFNVPRVAQLSQRSNQFNLRTIRYTEAEITQIETDDAYKTFSFTLEDKYGDNGLVSAVILKKQDDRTLFIETWFMSCRVLKRGMEQFIINTVVDYAKENGFEKIIGEYLPTAKNGIVANLYSTLGFSLLEPGNTRYVLMVDEFERNKCYISLK